MESDNDAVETILNEIEYSMEKLVRNDKIVINGLSYIAEDYKENEDVYPKIVDLIEARVMRVDLKLPLLYLIDSILKNVGQPYIEAFAINLVRIFSFSFEETQDPSSRRKLYDLRKTWIDVFPSEVLFALDRKVNSIDPAWPVTQVADAARVIHINPKFLKSESIEEPSSQSYVTERALPSTKQPLDTTSDERRLEIQTEKLRNTSRPLRLPLPQFYHDTPRPSGEAAMTSKHFSNSSKSQSSSSLRDPRLQRSEVEVPGNDAKSKGQSRNGISTKRKLASIKTEATFSDEERDTAIFLIDREGDESIEKRAAKKKAKKQAKKSSQKKEDQDLRRPEIPVPLPPPLPKLPPPPETIHSSADVDMRQVNNMPFPAVESARPPHPRRIPQPVANNEPGPTQFRPPPPQPLGPPPMPRPRPGFHRPMMGHPRPMRNGPRIPPRMHRPIGPYARPDRPMGPYNRPVMNHDDRPMNPGGGNGGPFGPPSRPMHPPNSGPTQRMRPLKIDKPRWIVRIPGLDEMPNIGTDPRLLTPCTQDPNQVVQEVTINGCSYTLLLDRLQPMIQVDGYYHAVRFRVEYLDCVFRHSLHVRIPGNGSTRINLGNKKTVTVCVGGPHHELIIDGRPYSIAFNGEMTNIQLRDMMVPVKIVTPRPRGLDVLPPIPTKILRWANGAHFGPPAMLHLSPLNPIERIEIQKASANISEVDITGETAQASQARVLPDMSIPTSSSSLASQSAASAPVNVFSLFDQLVKHGLVEKKKLPPTLDLDAFKLTEFMEMNEPARKLLYEGYQCTQCGQRYFNPESEEFTAHLDYHFITNNSAMQTGGKSRAYFETSDLWLLGTCGPAGQDDTDSEGGMEGGNTDTANQPTVEALSDDEQNQCSVCFEGFEIRYSDEEEAWLLVNAVKKDGLFYHPICVEDAWKGVAVDMAIDPHLALKKVLEGKMEAVYKPDADDSSSSDDDGVKVIVNTGDQPEEEELPANEEVGDDMKGCDDDHIEKDILHSEPMDQSEAAPPMMKLEPKGEPMSPETPLQDEEGQCGPSTPLTDENQFPHENDTAASLKSNIDSTTNVGPQTPVQDETVESTIQSNDSSPNTPVCDEIDEPATPVKDEPIWAS